MTDEKSIPHSVLLSVAERTALAAGRLIRSGYGQEVVIKEASQHDIKIELDSQTQKLIEGMLADAFPDHAILGEEGGEEATSQRYEWIVDPIDGTVNFSYGIPHFCVSIACRDRGTTVAGVVYDPMREEMFSAMKGQGAFLNGKKISASSRTQMSEMILSLGFSKSGETVKKCLELYQYYGPRSRKLRAMGAAAMDLAYIASGRIDAYIEQGIKIWDIAAGQLLLEEAGGKVVLTPLKDKHHYHIVASNGKLDFPVV